MTQQITHQSRYALVRENAYVGVDSLKSLDEGIINFGDLMAERCHESEDPNDVKRNACGMMYEVYNEFFCKRYQTDPKLGIRDIKDTSQNAFQKGFDFLFTTMNGNLGVCQTKWRSNPYYKFTESELETFVGMVYKMALKEDLELYNGAVLFTNVKHNPDVDNGSLFHYKFPADVIGDIRVIDRRCQEQYILRDPSFWDDFRTMLTSSSTEEFTSLPPHRPHQRRIVDFANTAMALGNRFTVRCATGGGKTNCEIDNIFTAFKTGDLVVFVAPTIALLNQHFDNCYDCGVFQGDVSAVCFKTGDEPRYNDTTLGFTQTTSMPELVDHLAVNEKTLVFVTYKSLERLLAGMIQHDITAELGIFDEAHKLITSNQNKIEGRIALLNTLPMDSAGFYSASDKHGRALSSYNTNLFGERVEVAYKELREAVILVSQINIIFVPVDRDSPFVDEFRQNIEAIEGVDYTGAYCGAAGTVAAYEHAHETMGHANMITWSDSVPNIKTIVKNDAVYDHLPTNTAVHSIHSNGGDAREDVFATIRTTDNNLLFQHSVCSEGLDAPGFNCAYVGRGLGIIESQQGPIGRLVRADPRDTAAFERGEITLDNPEGWHKYSVNVYVQKDSEEQEEFIARLQTLVEKLQFAGLTIDDVHFSEIQPSRRGQTPPPGGGTRTDVDPGLDPQALQETIDQIVLEVNEQARQETMRNVAVEYRQQPLDNRVSIADTLFD